MQTSMLKVLAGSLIATTLLTGAAYAQTQSVGSATPGTVDPGHPRVNEIDQRLDNQQQRIDNNVAKGDMTPAQAGRDEARDARIQQQAEKDEAKHGGHLTKREQRNLNRKLNHNSRDIHRQHNHAVKKKQGQ